MSTICTGAEGGKYDQNESGNQKRPLARPMVTEPSESELADDGASEGNRRDILGGRGFGVGLHIDLVQYGIDGTDSLR